jgi:hypothetical protein
MFLRIRISELRWCHRHLGAVPDQYLVRCRKLKSKITKGRKSSGFQERGPDSHPHCPVESRPLSPRPAIFRYTPVSRRGSGVKQIMRDVAKPTLAYLPAVLCDFRFQPCIAPSYPNRIPTLGAHRLSKRQTPSGGVSAYMVPLSQTGSAELCPAKYLCVAARRETPPEKFNR